MLLRIQLRIFNFMRKKELNSLENRETTVRNITNLIAISYQFVNRSSCKIDFSFFILCRLFLREVISCRIEIKKKSHSIWRFLRFIDDCVSCTRSASTIWSNFSTNEAKVNSMKGENKKRKQFRCHFFVDSTQNDDKIGKKKKNFRHLMLQ